ncbi:putative nuclease HARBI1 [Episyrphus balteatus]|uniref:putative nuclease HARBI1 n=1 Tax=Episyrphus balteatus TaxID=286459 RepID=UPI002485D9F3|nr:putative nuclease HARBI1 [Episyrphus balteatus]
MTKSCFKELLKEVKAIKQPKRKGRPIVSIETSLYVTLWGLCNQNCYRELSDRFDLSLKAVHGIIIKTCYLLLKLTKKYIRWPTSIESAHISEMFQAKSNPGFPSVIGCVDGTHLKINAPCQEPISYYNRKGYHSILLQAICDSNLVFRDVFFGWPGSSHDAHVWSNSPIGRALNSRDLKLPNDMHILGDSAYPLNTYLITPFRDNGFLSERERKFNYIHSSTRVAIEQAFGILKSKFRCLHHLKLLKLSNAKYIVMSCIILHNFIRIKSSEDVAVLFQDDVQSTEPEIQENEAVHGNVDAITKRDVLCEFLMS